MAHTDSMQKEQLFGEKSHLYYINNRLFINSVLGCASNCNYCYLDEIGLAKGKIVSEVNSSEIISTLEENPDSLWNPAKTLVQFGCYSDPWAKLSRNRTIDLIKWLDANNYKITLSTKQYIDTSDLNKLIGIENKYNLFFLISMPIVNNISSQEKGTSSLLLRLNSIDNLKKAGFKVAIYVKPFISCVTITGISIFESIMKDYNIPIILGRLFTSDGTGKIAVVSEKIKFYDNECDEYYFMKNTLSEFGSVYEHSCDVFSTPRLKDNEV
jgi:DNA repair photolyase